MATSGWCFRSHALAGSYPSKNRFQYGSCVSPLAMALPTAGMCELVTPPMILANPISSTGLELLDQAIAFREQLPLKFFGGDSLELGAGVLHRGPARDGHLGQVIDVRSR